MVVFAHGLVGRADLPIPAELFGVAAAVVLAVSFAALAVGWTRPRLEDAQPLGPPAPLVAEVALGILGVALFLVVVYSGFAGTEVATQNLAPTTIYVAFWVGIPLLSLLVGDVFRLLSPWRAVGRATGALVKRLGGDDATEPLPYPDRLGYWPAAIGLALFAAVELCWGRGDDPQVLALLACLYFLAQVVGMGLYGVETWVRRGDAFGVYFGLFASLSPLGFRAPRIPRAAGIVALLAVAIGATTFDGFKEGTFTDIAPHLQDFFEGLGLSKGAALEWAFVVGLLGCILFVAGIYLTGVYLARRGEVGAGADLRGRFVHSLIPIAAAYVLAHYFSLLAYQGQALWPLISDPLGDGSDLFGTAGRTIDYGVVSATAIWYVQVGALVCGHVAGLVLAHDRALRVYPTAGEATRSQISMLLVMIVFTSLGLWLLSVSNS